MKSRKKRIIKIVACALAVILLCVGVFGGYLLYRFNCDKSGSKYDYNAVYSQQTPTYDIGEDGRFTVLKINDTHLFNGVSKDDSETLSFIDKALKENTYDFIVVDGDLVEGFTLSLSFDKFQAISLFADIIEKYETPWAFAPGNNDGEIDGDNDAIIAFMMQYPHFVYGNTKDVYGYMQFFIDLTYNGELAHSLAILDSGMRRPKAVGKYENIQESQINWLLDGVNERKVPVSVFFHMPTPKFEAAYSDGEAYKDFRMRRAFSYNDIPKNKLFDDMTADNEYITLLSCAHQHSNNMCSFYEGRWYQLSSAGGYGAIGTTEPFVTITTIDVTAENTKDMYSFEQYSEWY